MSQKRRGFTLIELMIVVVVIGILAAVAIPNFISMEDRTAKTDKTKTAAHTLQLAVEDYAVRHDGVYSDRAEDLLPLLPGGKMLENGFTGQFSEPQFGASAKTPGEVGVQLISDGGRQRYIITAFGEAINILTWHGGN
ncbi:MAG: type II secretion system protein [Patescibacteria group bacterium]